MHSIDKEKGSDRVYGTHIAWIGVSDSVIVSTDPTFRNVLEKKSTSLLHENSLKYEIHPKYEFLSFLTSRPVDQAQKTKSGANNDYTRKADKGVHFE